MKNGLLSTWLGARPQRVRVLPAWSGPPDPMTVPRSQGFARIPDTFEGEQRGRAEGSATALGHKPGVRTGTF
jgi:hypothetical protein